MKTSKTTRRLLIIEDEVDLAEILGKFVKQLGFDPILTNSYVDAAKIFASQGLPDVVFSDIDMAGKSGLQFLTECREKYETLPEWVFISADSSPETLEKVVKLGALAVLQKPFSLPDLKSVLLKIEARTKDSLQEVMDLVQGIAGIKLGSDKKLLVETRLLRRARTLGLSTVDQYLDHFRRNRKKEVSELVSSLTTHTTEFFREPDHFDYLFEHVLPVLKSRSQPFKIWSAASSSGEEVYTLAILVFEFFRAQGVAFASMPKFQILGSDIDFRSIDKGRAGIYDAKSVEKLHPDLVTRYFDRGTGELSKFVRVKDFIHQTCHFEQLNLLSPEYDVPPADVVFVRNILIYFKSDDVQTVIRRIGATMKPGGLLFLGHSESLSNLEVPFRMIGNSIYESTAGTSLLPAEAPALSSARRLTRVLIVDDSPSIRKALRRVLTEAHGFRVVGEANHPLEADIILQSTQVDVITLDIHMPEMDGITYLEKLQTREHPPVVMVSSISYENAVESLRCFELGAVDYIEKPSLAELDQEAERIRVCLLAAAGSKRGAVLNLKKQSSERGSAERSEMAAEFSGDELIVIGASTGGTEAIKNVLLNFPVNSPPTLIVQHIPAVFSKAFADRLNELCEIGVSEAVHGEELKVGHAYIAPGGRHMGVKKSGIRLIIELNDEPPVNRHRPAVDHLFESVVPLLSEYRVSAAVLTGMGADGAKGLKLLRDSGAHTIAQDEDSCVVFGMPKEAIRLGGAIEVHPLPSIAYHLFKPLKASQAGKRKKSA